MITQLQPNTDLLWAYNFILSMPWYAWLGHIFTSCLEISTIMAKIVLFSNNFPSLQDDAVLANRFDPLTSSNAKVC